MSLKRFISQYLNFTTREKSGIVGLLIIIALLYFLPNLFYKEPDFSKELLAFEKQINALDHSSDEQNYSDSLNVNNSSSNTFNPFYFDPNTIDGKDLERFGLPKHVIERFLKYRAAGAKFYNKEDFKKVYGLKYEQYLKIEPFIKIENKFESAPSKFSNSQTNKPLNSNANKNQKITNSSVDINTADSLTLITVKGIGPYLSSKIIKYRTALGGFVTLDQLYEIFNIKREQVDLIKPFLSLNETDIKRLNINTADYYQLNNHPYISSKEANAIINYRKQHGLYKTSSDLEKVYILSKDWINKVVIYLEF